MATEEATPNEHDDSVQPGDAPWSGDVSESKTGVREGAAADRVPVEQRGTGVVDDRPVDSQGDGPGEGGQAALIQRSASYHLSMLRSGPLPEVEEFAGYEQVLPGAADRIMRMAEKEQDARIALNERDSVVNRRGFLIAATAGALLPWGLLVATVVLALIGAEGFAIAAGVLTALAGVPQIVDKIRSSIRHDGSEDSQTDEI